MKKTLFSFLAGAAILSAGCTQQPSPQGAPSTATRPATPASTVAAPPSAAPASAVPASGSPAASTSGAPVATAENWQIFKTPDGVMAIEAPVPLTAKADPNEPKAKMYSGQGGEGGRTWEIGSQPIPAALAKEKKPDEIANMALQSLCFSKGDAKANEVEINGKKGLMAKHQRDDGAVIGVFVCVVGDEAFMARVITPAESAQKLDFKAVSRFVNSFQINKTSGDASPAADSGGEKSEKGEGDK